MMRDRRPTKKKRWRLERATSGGGEDGVEDGVEDASAHELRKSSYYANGARNWALDS